MSQIQTLQVPVRGMDCNECVQHVQQALSSLPGVESATVFLASEKANIRYDPDRVNLPVMRKAVEAAGIPSLMRRLLMSHHEIWAT